MNHLILSVIFILLVIFLYTHKSTMKKVPELKPGKYVSMPFEEIKKYTDERINYIEKNKNRLNPYNKEKFDMIVSAIKNAKDLDTYTRAFITLPSFEVGYYPLLPLNNKPDDYMLFQYEQGFRGWYWVYGTFVEENGKNGCYFAYIIRVDLLPPDLRNKLNIPLGDSSYYMVSTGASVDGDWKYSKNSILPGEYTVIGKNNFNFKVDTDDIKLELNGKGDNFTISSFFNNYNIESQQNLNKFTSFNGNLHMKRPGFYNGKDGCMPCIEGAGTLYFSKTYGLTDAVINLNENTYEFVNGECWIDRQWMNEYSNSMFINALQGVKKTFSNVETGLPKYLWMPLIIKPDLQYMPYLVTNEPLTKGKKYEGTYITYGPDNTPKYNQKFEVEFLEFVNAYGENWPTKIYLYIDNGYILDTTPFGITVTPENSSGTIHWDGSAIIYDSQYNMVGTGFLEINKLQAEDSRNLQTLHSIGLDPKSNQKFFTDKLKFSQSWLAFLYFFLILLFIILSIYHLFKFFFHHKN
jgi:hypothetical protein